MRQTRVDDANPRSGAGKVFSRPTGAGDAPAECGCWHGAREASPGREPGTANTKRRRSCACPGGVELEWHPGSASVNPGLEGGVPEGAAAPEPVQAGRGQGRGVPFPTPEIVQAEPVPERAETGPGRGRDGHTPVVTQAARGLVRAERFSKATPCHGCQATTAASASRRSEQAFGEKKRDQETSSRTRWEISENPHSALSSFLTGQLHRKCTRCYVGHFTQLFHRPVAQKRWQQHLLQGHASDAEDMDMWKKNYPESSSEK
ncbi:RAD51-associated protein 1 isoform X2 [Passer montanus]|uniref:RAD51-associated protein 1 isoform X2 n=1 Tax=Passer montanus TaxID=9160 RepID=UPI00195FE64C|nr:RAD51-associated protein 1 isoform X2 [Passer montanus]